MNFGKSDALNSGGLLLIALKERKRNALEGNTSAKKWLKGGKASWGMSKWSL
jgi:hypothetical protein